MFRPFLFILFYFLFAGQLFAQRKEKVKDLQDYRYKKEASGGLRIQTNGFSLYGEYGWIKDIYRTRLLQLEYTYHIDLTKTEDTLLANLSSEKRKSLNKAKTDALEVVRETDMEKVKQVILKTFSRKQITKNKIYFDKILFDFANEKNAIAFVAYQNQKAIAATFCVYDSQRAYYLFGGYDSEFKHHGAGVSCMWQSILLAKQMGLQIFDFEGSMLPEVEKYFREFGGTLTPYYVTYKASTPLKLILKLNKRL